MQFEALPSELLQAFEARPTRYPLRVVAHEGSSEGEGLASSPMHLRLLVARQVAMVAVDMLCAIALLMLIAVPWKLAAFVKGRAPKQEGRGFHMTVLAHTAASVLELPLEAIAIACGAVTPWRWKAVGRTVFLSPSMAPHERRGVLCGLVRSSLLDLLVALMCVPLVLSMWRMPSLLFGWVAWIRQGTVVIPEYLTPTTRRPTTHTTYKEKMYKKTTGATNDFTNSFLQLRELKQRESGRRQRGGPMPYWSQVGEWVVSLNNGFHQVTVVQFVKLCLDLIQLLQVLWILATLVSTPALVWRVVRFEAALWRKAAYERRRHRQRRATEAKKAAEKAAELKKLAGTKQHHLRPRTLIECLPHQLPFKMFPYLDARDLGQVTQTCLAWVKEGRRGLYWAPLYLQRWPRTHVHPAVIVDGRSLYCHTLRLEIEKAESLRDSMRRAELTQGKQRAGARDPGMAAPPVAVDLAQGRRYVLHTEFLSSIQRFSHFLLIPLKVAGVALLPILAYLTLRNSLYRRYLLRYFPAGPRWRYDLKPLWSEYVEQSWVRPDLNFWGLHYVFVSLFITMFALVLDETSQVIASCNMVVFAASTLGGPLWARVGLPPPPHHLVDALMGLAVPCFVALQVYLLFLPNLSAMGTVLGAASTLLFTVGRGGAGLAQRGLLWGLDNLWIVPSGIRNGIRGIATMLLMGADGGGRASVGGGGSSSSSSGIGGVSAAPPVGALKAWRRDNMLGNVAVGAWTRCVDREGALGRACGHIIVGTVERGVEGITALITGGGALGVETTARAGGATAGAKFSFVPIFPGLASVPVGAVQQGMALFLLPFDALLGTTVGALRFLYGMQIPVLGVITRFLIGVIPDVLARRWVVQLLWTAVVVRSWVVFARWFLRAFPRASPLWMYFLPFRATHRAYRFVRQAVVLFARSYGVALGWATRVCKQAGIVGDVILVPLALAWIGGPAVAPGYLLSDQSLYAPGAILAVLLLVWGRDIIRRNWAILGAIRV